jgi:DoxX
MINLEERSDIAALIGRLFLSSMFLLFGYGKLTGYAGTVAYMGSLGLPSLFTLLAIIVEIGGGLLILCEPEHRKRFATPSNATRVWCARSSSCARALEPSLPRRSARAPKSLCNTLPKSA